MTDPAPIFAEAQRVFAAGDAPAALELLDRLPTHFSAHPDVWHLRALALKRGGRIEEARQAFAQALQRAPRDAQVANNYANLLKQSGAYDAALELYDLALAANPAYRDARFNKGLTLQALRRFEEAAALFAALCQTDPADAWAHSARATVLLALGRHDEAREAFDRALTLQPGLPVPLHGRARLALECGEADVAKRFERALRASPADLDLVLGLAEALESAATGDAIGLLGDTVARHPEWIAGLERLARMRAEAGEADFTSHYRSAIAQRPGDSGIGMSLADVLAQAGRHSEALAALGEDAADPATLTRRALYLGESGDPAAGLKLLERSGEPDTPQIDTTRARLALRLGEIDLAIRLLERSIAAEPELIHAWGMLELAWRWTDNPRSHWLSGQPGLVATCDVGLREDELAEVGEVLRGLHRTRAHPIGQSLRGGTQTRGRLFLRGEPELRRLSQALITAVAAHVDALPPFDPGHPLLRHRNQPMRIAGSWSVRLSDAGFHINHIHPEGLLSSACYIALPESNADKAGWLELGRPPSEFALPLEPLTMIEPLPGRLALFPSYLYHGTRPVSSGERLTVAFDVVVA